MTDASTNPSRDVDERGHPQSGSKWTHHSGRKYVVLFLTNDEPEPKEAYPLTVVYQNVVNGRRFSRRADDWHRSFMPTSVEESAREPDPVPPLKWPVRITVKMAKDPLSLRADLPTQFTWDCSMWQSEQMRKSKGVNAEGYIKSLNPPALTWAELAAILEVRPVSIMKELRAVMVCLRVAPQKGFQL